MRTWVKFYISTIFTFLFFMFIGRCIDNNTILTISFICFGILGFIFLGSATVIFIYTLKASIKEHNGIIKSITNIRNGGIYVEWGINESYKTIFIQTPHYDRYVVGEEITVYEYPTIVRIVMKDKYFIQKGYYEHA